LTYRLRKKMWYILRNRMPYNQAAWGAYHHPPPIEGARGCVRACMIHLETTGRIKARFNHPFRKKPTWTLSG